MREIETDAKPSCFTNSKSNGRIEIFEKKIHGIEVSHDRVKPLLRLFGQGGGGDLYNFYIGCPPPPCPASHSSGVALSRGTKT